MQFYAPDGENIVTAAGTPSDHRALANLIAELRRYGFEWKGRQQWKYRVTAKLAEHGRDAANAERVLDAFAVTAPNSGPVVSVNRSAGTLSITIAVDADDLAHGKSEIARIFTEGLREADLPATEILDVELVDVTGGAQLRRDLTLAQPGAARS